MIVKIPIYFSVEMKLPPDQVPEAIDFVQASFTKELVSRHGKVYKWSLAPKGEKTEFTILTKTDMLLRMFKKGKDSVKTPK